MKIYTFHINPDVSESLEAPKVIPESFNFSAFAFGAFWTMVQRHWPATLLLIVINISIGVLYSNLGLSMGTVSAANFLVLFYLGMIAPDLKREVLRRKGYVTADVIAARNLDEARLRYFSKIS